VIFLIIAGVLVAAFAVKAQATTAPPVTAVSTLPPTSLTKTDFYPTSKDVRSASQMVTEGAPIVFNPQKPAAASGPSSAASVPPGAPGGAPSGSGGSGTGATGGRGVPNVY
jgi:hypothetical protein